MGRYAIYRNFCIIPASLLVLLCFCQVDTAPVQQSGGVRSPREKGCYYLSTHYENGERIETNEPCLNCTCTNSALMCYLRICPFVKPVGEDCIIERHEGDCCPKIWCPEVVPNNCSDPAHGPDHEHELPAGCFLNGLYYEDGAQLPRDPKRPCEVCYCIRNTTACVMQECDLKVQGCTPVYRDGQCCPCRYNCTYEETTTAPPGITLEGLAEGCVISEGHRIADGEAVNSTNPCEHCYCMRNEVVCAIQECQAPNDLCKPLQPKDGQCCPDRYECPVTSTDSTTVDFMSTTGLTRATKTPLTFSTVFTTESIDEHVSEEESTTTSITVPSSSSVEITSYISTSIEPSESTTAESLEGREPAVSQTPATTITVTYQSTTTSVPQETSTSSPTTKASGLLPRRPILPSGGIPGEQRVTFTPVDEGTSKDSTTSADSSVTPLPAEGVCHIDGVTLRNGQKVRSSDPCKINCRCLNSLIVCDEITCEAPPKEAVEQCQAISLPEECCTRYECEPSEDVDLLSAPVHIRNLTKEEEKTEKPDLTTEKPEISTATTGIKESVSEETKGTAETSETDKSTEAGEVTSTLEEKYGPTKSETVTSSEGTSPKPYVSDSSLAESIDPSTLTTPESPEKSATTSGTFSEKSDSVSTTAEERSSEAEVSVTSTPEYKTDASTTTSSSETSSISPTEHTSIPSKQTELSSPLSTEEDIGTKSTTETLGTSPEIFSQHTDVEIDVSLNTKSEESRPAAVETSSTFSVSTEKTTETPSSTDILEPKTDFSSEVPRRTTETPAVQITEEGVTHAGPPAATTKFTTESSTLKEASTSGTIESSTDDEWDKTKADFTTKLVGTTLTEHIGSTNVPTEQTSAVTSSGSTDAETSKIPTDFSVTTESTSSTTSGAPSSVSGSKTASEITTASPEDLIKISTETTELFSDSTTSTPHVVSEAVQTTAVSISDKTGVPTEVTSGFSSKSQEYTTESVSASSETSKVTTDIYGKSTSTEQAKVTTEVSTEADKITEVSSQATESEDEIVPRIRFTASSEDSSRTSPLPTDISSTHTSVSPEVASDRIQTATESSSEPSFPESTFAKSTSTKPEVSSEIHKPTSDITSKVTPVSTVQEQSSTEILVTSPEISSSSEESSSERISTVAQVQKVTSEVTIPTSETTSTKSEVLEISEHSEEQSTTHKASSTPSGIFEEPQSVSFNESSQPTRAEETKQDLTQSPDHVTRPETTHGLLVSSTFPSDDTKTTEDFWDSDFDGCTVNGSTYEDGDQIKTLDPCEHCFCALGEVLCSPIVCSRPIPPGCTPVPPKDEKECCSDVVTCVEPDGSTKTVSLVSPTSPIYDQDETLDPDSISIHSRRRNESSLPEISLEEETSTKASVLSTTTKVPSEGITERPESTTDAKETSSTKLAEVTQRTIEEFETTSSTSVEEVKISTEPVTKVVTTTSESPQTSESLEARITTLKPTDELSTEGKTLTPQTTEATAKTTAAGKTTEKQDTETFPEATKKSTTEEVSSPTSDFKVTEQEQSTTTNLSITHISEKPSDIIQTTKKVEESTEMPQTTHETIRATEIISTSTKTAEEEDKTTAETKITETTSELEGTTYFSTKVTGHETKTSPVEDITEEPSTVATDAASERAKTTVLSDSVTDATTRESLSTDVISTRSTESPGIIGRGSITTSATKEVSNTTEPVVTEPESKVTHTDDKLENKTEISDTKKEEDVTELSSRATDFSKYTAGAIDTTATSSEQAKTSTETSKKTDSTISAWTTKLSEITEVVSKLFESSTSVSSTQKTSAQVENITTTEAEKAMHTEGVTTATKLTTDASELSAKTPASTQGITLTADVTSTTLLQTIHPLTEETEERAVVTTQSTVLTSSTTEASKDISKSAETTYTSEKPLDVTKLTTDAPVSETDKITGDVTQVSSTVTAPTKESEVSKAKTTETPEESMTPEISSEATEIPSTSSETALKSTTDREMSSIFDKVSTSEPTTKSSEFTTLSTKLIELYSTAAADKNISMPDMAIKELTSVTEKTEISSKVPATSASTDSVTDLIKESTESSRTTLEPLELQTGISDNKTELPDVTRVKEITTGAPEEIRSTTREPYTASTEITKITSTIKEEQKTSIKTDYTKQTTEVPSKTISEEKTSDFTSERTDESTKTTVAFTSSSLKTTESLETSDKTTESVERIETISVSSGDETTSSSFSVPSTTEGVETTTAFSLKPTATPDVTEKSDVSADIVTTYTVPSPTVAYKETETSIGGTEKPSAFTMKFPEVTDTSVTIEDASTDEKLSSTAEISDKPLPPVTHLSTGTTLFTAKDAGLRYTSPTTPELHTTSAVSITEAYSATSTGKEVTDSLTTESTVSEQPKSTGEISTADRTTTLSTRVPTEGSTIKTTITKETGSVSELFTSPESTSSSSAITKEATTYTLPDAAIHTEETEKDSVRTSVTEEETTSTSYTTIDKKIIADTIMEDIDTSKATKESTFFTGTPSKKFAEMSTQVSTQKMETDATEVHSTVTTEGIEPISTTSFTGKEPEIHSRRKPATDDYTGYSESTTAAKDTSYKASDVTAEELITRGFFSTESTKFISSTEETSSSADEISTAEDDLSSVSSVHPSVEEQTTQSYYTKTTDEPTRKHTVGDSTVTSTTSATSPVIDIQNATTAVDASAEVQTSETSTQLSIKITEKGEKEPLFEFFDKERTIDATYITSTVPKETKTEYETSTAIAKETTTFSATTESKEETSKTEDLHTSRTSVDPTNVFKAVTFETSTHVTSEEIKPTTQSNITVHKDVTSEPTRGLASGETSTIASTDISKPVTVFSQEVGDTTEVSTVTRLEKTTKGETPTSEHDHIADEMTDETPSTTVRMMSPDIFEPKTETTSQAVAVSAEVSTTQKITRIPEDITTKDKDKEDETADEHSTETSRSSTYETPTTVFMSSATSTREVDLLTAHSTSEGLVPRVSMPGEDTRTTAIEDFQKSSTKSSGTTYSTPITTDSKTDTTLSTQKESLYTIKLRRPEDIAKTSPSELTEQPTSIGATQTVSSEDKIVEVTGRTTQSVSLTSETTETLPRTTAASEEYSSGTPTGTTVVSTVEAASSLLSTGVIDHVSSRAEEGITSSPRIHSVTETEAISDSTVRQESTEGFLITTEPSFEKESSTSEDISSEAAASREPATATDEKIDLIGTTEKADTFSVVSEVSEMSTIAETVSVPSTTPVQSFPPFPLKTEVSESTTRGSTQPELVTKVDQTTSSESTSVAVTDSTVEQEHSSKLSVIPSRISEVESTTFKGESPAEELQSSTKESTAPYIITTKEQDSSISFEEKAPSTKEAETTPQILIIQTVTDKEPAKPLEIDSRIRTTDTEVVTDLSTEPQTTVKPKEENETKDFTTETEVKPLSEESTKGTTSLPSSPEKEMWTSPTTVLEDTTEEISETILQDDLGFASTVEDKSTSKISIPSLTSTPIIPDEATEESQQAEDAILGRRKVTTLLPVSETKEPEVISITSTMQPSDLRRNLTTVPKLPETTRATVTAESSPFSKPATVTDVIFTTAPSTRGPLTTTGIPEDLAKRTSVTYVANVTESTSVISSTIDEMIKKLTTFLLPTKEPETATELLPRTVTETPQSDATEATESPTTETEIQPVPPEEGYCFFEGQVFHSAEQIPRSDPCEFCFCFRSDIICLQQTCPPPIKGCYATPIRGFCCPRFQCPVQESRLNFSTTTTTTARPYGFLSQKTVPVTGCEIDGTFYRVGQVVRPASGPCIECTCEFGGMMKCDPQDCQPQAPLLLRMNREFFNKRR